MGMQSVGESGEAGDTGEAVQMPKKRKGNNIRGMGLNPSMMGRRPMGHMAMGGTGPGGVGGCMAKYNQLSDGCVCLRAYSLP